MASQNDYAVNLDGLAHAGTLVPDGSPAPSKVPWPNLSGAGAPVSGPGGTIADFSRIYLDTSPVAPLPPVPYMQMSKNTTSPLWVSIPTGVVV